MSKSIEQYLNELNTYLDDIEESIPKITTALKGKKVSVPDKIKMSEVEGYVDQIKSGDATNQQGSLVINQYITYPEGFRVPINGTAKFTHKISGNGIERTIVIDGEKSVTETLPQGAYTLTLGTSGNNYTQDFFEQERRIFITSERPAQENVGYTRKTGVAYFSVESSGYFSSSGDSLYWFTWLQPYIRAEGITRKFDRKKHGMGGKSIDTCHSNSEVYKQSFRVNVPTGSVTFSTLANSSGLSGGRYSDKVTPVTLNIEEGKTYYPEVTTVRSYSNSDTGNPEEPSVEPPETDGPSI